MLIHPLENVSMVKAELDHPSNRIGQQTGTMHQIQIKALG